MGQKTLHNRETARFRVGMAAVLVAVLVAGCMGPRRPRPQGQGTPVTLHEDYEGAEDGSELRRRVFPPTPTTGGRPGGGGDDPTRLTLGNGASVPPVPTGPAPRALPDLEVDPPPALPSAGGVPVPRAYPRSAALVIPAQHVPDPAASLRRQLDAAARLGASMVLLTPAVSRTSGGGLEVNGQDIGMNADELAHGVVLWSTLSNPPPLLRLAAEDASGILFTLAASDVHGRRGDAQLHLAARQLRSAIAQRATHSRSLVLISDVPLWRRRRPLWRSFSGALEEAGTQAALIAFADTDSLHWTQSHGLPCVSVPVTAPADQPDGQLVWLASAAGRTRVSLVDVNAVVDVRRRNLLADERRKALIESCSAGPTHGPNSVTTVVVGNPTEEVLDFEAEWQVERGTLQVDPDILGFQLGPGETFRQQFQLLSGKGPLRFLRPRLALRTTLAGPGMDRPQPVEILLEPWCTMTGRIERTDATPVLDGDPAEWAGAPVLLGHVTQLVDPASPWQGTADLSANLYFAYDNGALFVAARVFDRDRGEDVPERPGTVLFAFAVPNPDTGEDAVTSLQIDSVGQVSGSLPRERIDISHRVREDGFQVEGRLPLDVLGGGRDGAPLRLDVLLSNARAGQSGGTVLRLSGQGTQVSTPDLFAEFFFASPSPEGP